MQRKLGLPRSRSKPSKYDPRIEVRFFNFSTRNTITGSYLYETNLLFDFSGSQGLEEAFPEITKKGFPNQMIAVIHFQKAKMAKAKTATSNVRI